MRRKSKRLVLIGGALGVAGLAAALVLSALRDSVVFFYGPAELAAKAVPPGTRLRIGGLVRNGSLERLPGSRVDFVVTDNTKDMKVTYTGLVPDLFREGQGVVAEGVLETPGLFRADTILAKHDESYMPRDVADALKKSGTWRGEARSGAAPTDRTASRGGS